MFLLHGRVKSTVSSSTHLICFSELWDIMIWATTWQNEQSEWAPSKDSDQPGHPPSLIRIFTIRMKKAWVLSYPLSVQRRLWSDWADAQADLSLRWVHTHFVGFVMSWLIYYQGREHYVIDLFFCHVIGQKMFQAGQFLNTTTSL